VQFAPGTLHRAVNSGGLVVLAIMGNDGLAGRGDARISFGAEADADPDLWAQLWTLPARKELAGALERRDRSVAAYMQLLRLWDGDRDAYRSALSAFIDLHARAMAPLRARFQSVVAQRPASWLQKRARAPSTACRRAAKRRRRRGSAPRTSRNSARAACCVGSTCRSRFER
jgi:hypothetical protein